jgi:hypothetical protein
MLSLVSDRSLHQIDGRNPRISPNPPKNCSIFGTSSCTINYTLLSTCYFFLLQISLGRSRAFITEQIIAITTTLITVWDFMIEILL